VILFVLAGTALARDVPFSLRETKDSLDGAAINQNFRGLADDIRRERARILELESNVAVSTGTNNWTEDQVFGASVTVTGTIINPAIPTTYGVWTGTTAVPENANSTWGINITSITKISTGRYELTLTTPYANPNVGFSLTGAPQDTSISMDVFDIQYPIFVAINNAGTVKDCQKCTIILYGELDP